MRTKSHTLVLFPNWSASRDAYGWQLTQIYTGKDKDGRPKAKERNTYHPTLAQCARYIIDVEASHKETLENLLHWLERAAEGVAERAQTLAP